LNKIGSAKGFKPIDLSSNPQVS